MSLRVGINSDVKLVGATINDKGSLQISFTSGDNTERSVTDLLNATTGFKDFSTTNIISWPINVEVGGQPKEIKNIARDLSNLRDQLEQILGGYMTSDQAALDPYAGLDTTDPVAFQRSLEKQSTVDRIYKNLTTQFVSKVSSLISSGVVTTQTFRLKLVRTSKKNHYGTLPKGFVRDNPFWESMSIPATSSKVKFTAYELKNGFDNPNAIDKEEVADTTTASTEQTAASAILGSR